jgi:hypothetical protein
MIKPILTILSIAILTTSCTIHNLTNIQPKSGSLEIPVKGEVRIWENIEHTRFDVVLINTNATQSCEVYYVKGSGTEKWISPSLIAKRSLKVTIPRYGYLLLKNPNSDKLVVEYKVIDKFKYKPRSRVK